ncbi:MAG: hypothetical protein R2843_13745 [Thermomicrobiales bacterium]
MKTVNERHILHRIGEWREEMLRAHENVNRLIDIANKNERGFGWNLLATAA